jgi:hypothetical protein
MLELEVIKNIDKQEFFEKSKEIKNKIKNIREFPFGEYLVLIPVFFGFISFLFYIYYTIPFFSGLGRGHIFATITFCIFNFLCFAYLTVILIDSMLQIHSYIAGDWFLSPYNKLVREYDKKNFIKYEKNAFKTNNYKVMAERYGHLDCDMKNDSYHMIDSINVIKFIKKSNEKEKEFLKKYSHLNLNNTACVIYYLVAEWIDTHTSSEVVKNIEYINNMTESRLSQKQYDIIFEKINKNKLKYKQKNIKNF